MNENRLKTIMNGSSVEVFQTASISSRADLDSSDRAHGLPLDYLESREEISDAKPTHRLSQSPLQDITNTFHNPLAENAPFKQKPTFNDEYEAFRKQLGEFKKKLSIIRPEKEQEWLQSEKIAVTTNTGSTSCRTSIQRQSYRENKTPSTHLFELDNNNKNQAKRPQRTCNLTERKGVRRSLSRIHKKIDHLLETSQAVEELEGTICLSIKKRTQEIFDRSEIQYQESSKKKKKNIIDFCSNETFHKEEQQERQKNHSPIRCPTIYLPHSELQTQTPSLKTLEPLHPFNESGYFEVKPKELSFKKGSDIKNNPALDPFLVSDFNCSKDQVCSQISTVKKMNFSMDQSSTKTTPSDIDLMGVQELESLYAAIETQRSDEKSFNGTQQFAKSPKILISRPVNDISASLNTSQYSHFFQRPSNPIYPLTYSARTQVSSSPLQDTIITIDIESVEGRDGGEARQHSPPSPPVSELGPSDSSVLSLGGYYGQPSLEDSLRSILNTSSLTRPIHRPQL